MGKAETKNKNVAMASRLKQEGVQRRNATCTVCHKPLPGSQHGIVNHMLKCGGNYR